LKLCSFLSLSLSTVEDGFPHYASNLRMEIASRSSTSSDTSAPPPADSPASSSAEPLYLRLLWNDAEISFPGFDAWCPLEVVVQKLHAGALGVEDSTAKDGGGSRWEEATLNALDDLDSVLNDALANSDSEAAES
jgi:hypothetical protein